MSNIKTDVNWNQDVNLALIHYRIHPTRMSNYKTSFNWNQDTDHVLLHYNQWEHIIGHVLEFDRAESIIEWVIPATMV